MSLSLSNSCVPASFNLSGIFGTEIRHIDTTLVTNYSASVLAVSRYTAPSVELMNATFCNVTVTYTHPGQNDNIIVEAWLPVDNWNSRFQAIGGGGFVAGRYATTYTGMEGAISDGYATITTDAGLGSAITPYPWALLSPGNINSYNLQNLASVSLSDAALMGKSLIKSFYGKDPDFSYWNGCSQGGRQGLMLAQRYPTLYDGIAAGSPAIFWAQAVNSGQWPQQVMNMLGSYPYPCELDAITAAAVAACDKLDGVVDGIIAEIDACKATFDPFSLVGSSINCSEAGGMVNISETAATVANATWNGVRTASGNQSWYGLNPGADLTGSHSSPETPVVAATNCTTGVCVGAPTFLAYSWFQLFVAKNPTYNLTGISHDEFDQLGHLSQNMYESIMGTNDPDLSGFRNAGGKLMTFHGLADSVIPPKGTEHYYTLASSITPDIDDFYRHFPIPGLGHCYGGRSLEPTSFFEQLRAWVENGTAPETTPVQANGTDGKVRDRVLCRYPRKMWPDGVCRDVQSTSLVPNI
ncbi:tannase and feruloyl esterase [Nemania sp. FL0031]|nr:tannase and feruloyl esterase [Nemania sp. FL0031]